MSDSARISTLGRLAVGPWAATLLMLVVICGLLAQGHFVPDVSAKPRHKSTRLQPEIVGGSIAPGRDYPFMAIVETDWGFCGGTLIDGNSVLTAGHCVSDDGGNLLPAHKLAISVGISTSDRGKIRERHQFSAAAVSRHPAFSYFPLTNDVAVITLARPVPPSLATPVTIAPAGSTHFEQEGQGVVAAGWGLLEAWEGDVAPQLHQVDLAVSSTGACYAAYPAEYDPGTMLCAGLPGKDTCDGDSGGPLLFRTQIGTTTVSQDRGRGKGDHANGKKREHGKSTTRTGSQRSTRSVSYAAAVYENVQVGITSFGASCADPNFPGVYTRLSNPGINRFIQSAAAG